MKSPLNCWYLDDGTLGGETEIVLNDLLKIKDATQSHGLELNPSKCELFLVNSSQFYSNNIAVTNVVKSFNDIYNGIKVIEKSDLSLLGSPIFPEAIEPILKP